MKYFCVPADFKKETIEKYYKLNEGYSESKVIETYGNITIENFLCSGRVTSQLPKVDLLDLYDYIQFSNKNGIEFNYTMNGPHMLNAEYTKDGASKIIKFLHNLHDAGCRSLTIALPSLIELVRSTKLDFKIKASTLCQITNVNKALAYKQMTVDRIVTDESINKDFDTLKNIRNAFGEKVEIIANPICYKDCVYRMFHYNQVANDSIEKTNETSRDYFEHRCVLQRFSRISNLLRMAYVRPEDLNLYSSIGINYFKLQGRHVVLKGDPIRTLKAYFDESYDGDVMDLINMFYDINKFKVILNNKKLEGFIKPFFEKKIICKHDCDRCNYCETFAKKVIDFDSAIEIKNLAEQFYPDFDQFNELLNSINKSNIDFEEKKENIDLSLD